jgi:hypothetical protein
MLYSELCGATASWRHARFMYLARGRIILHLGEPCTGCENLLRNAFYLARDIHRLQTLDDR